MLSAQLSAMLLKLFVDSIGELVMHEGLYRRLLCRNGHDA